MILNQQIDYIHFSCGKSEFCFLPTGGIFEFTNGDCMINGFQGNPVSGSANNIYLRTYNGDKVTGFTPLLGANSNLSKGDNSLTFTGVALGVSYTVVFAIGGDGLWFWHIFLDASDAIVDLVYAQDIGMAAKGGVLTNELYISQYLGNTIFNGDNGYVVCSRQNQSQGGSFPYLQQGCIGAKVNYYSTDATQFFGLSYRETDVPCALHGNLENRNYQFELSYTALQTERITLNGGASLAFYGLFKSNHTEAITSLEFADEICAAYKATDKLSTTNAAVTPCYKLELSPKWGDSYASPSMDKSEIDRLFGHKKLEEFGENGQLLSFFTDSYEHVVLKEKELMCERPHGHIITTLLSDQDVSTGLITSTNYMYGVFNGQVVAGNTSLHKFISTPRGLLNILKNTGQRIYVKIDDVYRILTIPALYEIGINYSKWYYKIADDILVVTSYAAADTADIVLNINSSQGKKYDIVITSQLVMGECEFQNGIEFVEDELSLTFNPLADNWKNSPYKNLHYTMQLSDSATISDDKIFYTDNKTRNGTLLTIEKLDTASFSITTQGRIENCVQTPACHTFDVEKQKYQDFYSKLICGFNLTLEGGLQDELDRLNCVALWYSHNAMVHFAVPHGLEQPGGAAWGTRDVCQGPMEYFLATRHYSLAKSVLLNLFAHQTLEGEWPQWFMFDKYTLHQDDCHGDIVFWPLKCICDYINASGDVAILNSSVGYLASDANETILLHLKRAISTLDARFLHGTSLISYAGGDWDDTLQPANKELADYLVSAWTMALAYQSIHLLSCAVAPIDEIFGKQMKTLCNNIKADFNKYLVKDGVIAGFAYCKDMEHIRYMLHPDDNETGIHYRLLPLTRSIIGEMVDLPQAEFNVGLIDEHLQFPDGVRLMDKPAHYNGGVCKFFQRAEQAANVGREISLQYVHAHIRYIEAMAKLGHGDNAWNGLLKINPVNIQKSVKNAQLRQSNSYFSSSEGAFDDRYDYQNNFDSLKDNKTNSDTIKVKGGWRIYSSGPGIYLNQLVSNVLGIRFTNEAMEIDPALPQKLDGLCFQYNCFGKAVHFVYHISGGGDSGVSKVLLNQAPIDFSPIANPYRSSGASIAIDTLNSLLEIKNVIDVYC